MLSQCGYRWRTASRNRTDLTSWRPAPDRDIRELTIAGSNVQNIISRSCTMDAGSETLEKEGNIVSLITRDPSLDLIKGYYGNSIAGFSNDQYWLISPVVPVVFATKPTPSNFEEIAAQQFDQSINLFARQILDEIGGFCQNFLNHT